MQTSSEYFDRTGYLLITVLVSWTEGTARHLIDETYAEATKRGYIRLLFDLRNWLAPDAEYTRFASGLQLAEVLQPPFKVAAFGFRDSISRFGEDVAVNRGAHFRIFFDEQTALDWLMEDGGD